MSGIAGWIGFGSGPGHTRSVLDAMAATTSRDAPAEVYAWRGARVALAAAPGGIAEERAEDGQGVAVVFDGVLHDTAPLRAALSAHGHRARHGTDAEAALHAYLAWGADCAEHLDGAFAFAVFDSRRGRLLLVRDRLGVRPLHYARLNDTVYFASEPKALLAGSLLEPVLDADGLRELFTQAKTPGASVFRGIAEVRPGHLLDAGEGGVAERPYWTLEARPHTDDPETTVATVHSLLADSVGRAVEGDAVPCSLLSGGLDSGAITALAALALKDRGRLRTATATFIGYAENFRPDNVRTTPDAPYAAEVARHIGSDHTDVVLGTADLLEPRLRRAVLRAQDRPTPFAEMDVAGLLIFRAAREHSPVALSGEGADEIFGGFTGMYEPDAAGPEQFPWVAYERSHEASRHGLGLGLFDRGLLGKLDLAAYGADRYRQAVAEVPRLDGESDRDRRLREVCHLHLVHWLPRLLDRDDRLSRAAGLQVRMPFCDHRLVEYLFNVPWELKTRGGREKSLLRSAVGDLLPRSVVERRKSPFPVNQDPAYTHVLRRELMRVLDDPDSPVAPLLDPVAARAAGAEARGGAHWLTRTNIEMVLQLHLWLTEYGVRLAL
ncbi:asparagine synthase (glutamine-hydrolyzing) [Streptomyces glomeratus]|uniref:asparagine synthase (glutamine-hydrolyzing) n=1 Tax=Streptomyces glomeratus TaxID=284452 RepID=A0ABP6L1I4_9ACTN|nr:asparagine synthase (glutamine-hydrolyzing) [Streptomyces glomeratus]MCF1509552.1 asparagine synthase (glutamine-hydrolyzing) [Streptomyces glomeratus]